MKRRRPWTPRTIGTSVAVALTFFLTTTAQAQNATIISTCDSGTNSVTFSVPTSTTQDEVDVFFLFDDTGTFTASSTTVSRAFETIITGLVDSYPSVSWGFGVGKFEDFGSVSCM